MDLVERWWNSQHGTLGRRDIWLKSDGNVWHVRARNGGADGDEVQYDYAHEWQARAMVDRLIKAAPSGRWKNITDLVARPEPSRPPTGPADADRPE